MLDYELKIKGVTFKELNKQDQIAFLNDICGVAHLHGLISSSERKKIFERVKKKIEKILKEEPK